MLQQGIKMFAGAEYEGFDTVGDKAGSDVGRSILKNCVRGGRRLDIDRCVADKAVWGSAGGLIR